MAPHCLFEKGCHSQPKHSLVNEMLTKGQELKGAHPEGCMPKVTWYRPCASLFLVREKTTVFVQRGLKVAGHPLEVILAFRTGQKQAQYLEKLDPIYP